MTPRNYDKRADEHLAIIRTIALSLPLGQRLRIQNHCDRLAVLYRKQQRHLESLPETDDRTDAQVAGQMIYLAQLARIRDFDGKTAILMATALDQMMLQHKDIADLTLPEIADAFKGGVFGFYGEFYGLSAPNLYGFICGFLESSKKKEATDLVLKSKVQAYRERTRAEQEERQRAIRAEMEEAERNGTFVPTGKAWFKPKMVNDVMRESSAL